MSDGLTSCCLGTNPEPVPKSPPIARKWRVFATDARVDRERRIPLNYAVSAALWSVLTTRLTSRRSLVRDRHRPLLREKSAGKAGDDFSRYYLCARVGAPLARVTRLLPGAGRADRECAQCSEWAGRGMAFAELRPRRSVAAADAGGTILCEAVWEHCPPSARTAAGAPRNRRSTIPVEGSGLRVASIS